jgi:hypothetical protein
VHLHKSVTTVYLYTDVRYCQYNQTLYELYCHVLHTDNCQEYYSWDSRSHWLTGVWISCDHFSSTSCVCSVTTTHDAVWWFSFDKQVRPMPCHFLIAAYLTHIHTSQLWDICLWSSDSHFSCCKNSWDQSERHLWPLLWNPVVCQMVTCINNIYTGYTFMDTVLIRGGIVLL